MNHYHLKVVGIHLKINEFHIKAEEKTDKKQIRLDSEGEKTYQGPPGTDQHGQNRDSQGQVA